MPHPGNVRPLNRRLSESYATPIPPLTERMKSYTLAFVALATVLLYIEYTNAMELCPQENCLTPNKCEQLVLSSAVSCNEQGTSCCSVVKEEYRTHCRHHGGSCMNSCAKALVRPNVVDCTDGQVCCVLV
ncbi:PREDICTED: uncharacterized protein LOC105565046 [Vollenhovia emeryi]|uniref:uncharacterized protein LOC105565046 n=1 Tax=Vollenhovia emeryi TaxID=411798 RepID=UPI0005F48E3B|nr:PREDICTED: uncharacterized protein LOC105565046 [Vollenhovia emeryi]